MRAPCVTAALLLCTVATGASAATLTGSTVGAALYCCTAPTDDIWGQSKNSEGHDDTNRISA